MALFKLTDAVVPQTFQNVIEGKLLENNPIRQSGIVTTDPRFEVNKGFETTVPYWRRPAGGEAMSQSGDESQIGGADKVSQGKMTARVISRARALSAMNIASYASTGDAKAAINFASGEFGRLRVSDEESTVLAILKGIAAANAANRTVASVDSDPNAPAGVANDMITNKAITTGTIAAANKFSYTVMLEARKQLGDRGANLKTMIVHSDIVNALRVLEPTSIKQPSETNLALQSYMGVQIIETDNVGIDTTVANYPVYTSYFCGSDLFAYAAGVQDDPLEDVRNAAAGNWSGVDTTVNRFRYMMHIYGWMATGNPSNGVSLTNAELATGTNWKRAVERKAIDLAIIKTNG